MARRRREVDQREFESFYQAGDEIASIISGLIYATFREEATADQSTRAVKEDSVDYKISEDDSTS